MTLNKQQVVEKKINNTTAGATKAGSIDNA